MISNNILYNIIGQKRDGSAKVSQNSSAIFFKKLFSLILHTRKPSKVQKYQLLFIHFKPFF